jgi:hypothetical protein
MQHLKTCSLNPEAVKQGYVLYANDGRWLNLDQTGNELAHEAIEHSISNAGMYVSILGELQGDTIAVKRLIQIMDVPAGTTR